MIRDIQKKYSKMLVAKKKRKENIVEYILYLYQIEDLIRAYNLNLDLIKNQLVASYRVDNHIKQEIFRWYENLVVMMQKEGKQKTGHLQFINNLITEVYEFHLRLLQTETDKLYLSVYPAVNGLVAELFQKNKNANNNVQVAIDGIYGYLLLKIQKKDISQETEQAMKRLSHWLAYLSKLYRRYEKGDLDILR